MLAPLSFLLLALFLKDWALAGGAQGGMAQPASIPARCDTLRPFVLPSLPSSWLSFQQTLPRARSTRAPVGACGLRLSLGKSFSDVSGFHLHVFLP